MYIDSDTTLAAMVKSYRTAASNLRRFDQNRAYPGQITKHSETQKARMDNVREELLRRDEMILPVSLDREDFAHRQGDRAMLTAQRAVIRHRLKREADEQYRADLALQRRLELIDRFEILYEIHQGDTEGTRIAQSTLAQRLAWDRASLNIAVFEEKFEDMHRDSTKWYSTFLDLYDTGLRGLRAEFSRHLDGLVHDHLLHEAAEAGFVVKARVVQETMTGTRLGKIQKVDVITNASVSAATVRVMVFWDDGQVSQGDTEHFTLLGRRDRLDLMEASISWRREGSDILWNLDEEDDIFESAEDITRQVLDLIESGATEVHIDRIRAV